MLYGGCARYGDGGQERRGNNYDNRGNRGGNRRRAEYKIIEEAKVEIVPIEDSVMQDKLMKNFDSFIL